MSKTIDERVVSMKFDNKTFETNVAQTVKSVDTLKSSLNFKGASSGLDNISSSVKNVSMEPLANAIDTVKLRFSALQIAAITALTNITNQAFNTGQRMIKALTIDPIMSGLSEYETKINSIQTIMSNTASKGSTMADVTRVIDELNTYADKTIYNFAEMTRNIGTFTAAGVELETAASAIQGIANLAAASGSNSQQASTAMYQLSQALAAGTVKLMDWNSVVNAGMGGQLFQDALKATAKEMGVVVDESLSFRETLESGWLSADILNTTLQKFTVEGAKEYSKSMMEMGHWTQEQADALIAEATSMEDAATKVKTFTQLWATLTEAAQSGWSKSWELIIGDFDEAKEFLTEINDIIGGLINESADARNAVIGQGLGSGWKQFIGEGIADAAGYEEAVRAVASTHIENFDAMIEENGGFAKSLKTGWLTADIMSQALSDLTGKTAGLTDEEIELLGYTREQIDSLEELNTQVQNGSIDMEKYADSMTMVSGRENLIQSLRNVFEALMAVITPLKNAFEEIFPPLTAEQLYNMTVAIEEFTSKLIISEDTVTNIQTTFSGLFSIVKKVGAIFASIIPIITGLASHVGPALDTILEMTGAMGEWVLSLNLSTGTLYSVTNAIGEGIANIDDNLKALWETITNTDNTLIQGIVGAIESVFEAITGADFSNILDIANAGSLGALAISFSKFTDMIQVNGSDLKSIFSGFTGFGKSFNTVLGTVNESLQAWQSSLKAKALYDIGKAIAVIAVALFVLSLIDEDKLTTALTAMTAIFVELGIFTKAILASPQSMTKLVGLSAALISLSIAVLILAAAVYILAKLEWDEMIRGLVGIAGLAAIVTKAASVLGASGKKLMKGAFQLILFAAAIYVLTLAVKSMAEISWEDMIKGLTGIGTLFAIIGAFVNNTTYNSKGMFKAAVSLVVIAAALLILTEAVIKLGAIPGEQLITGLVGVAGLLGMLSLFTRFTKSAGNMISTGLGLLLLAVSIKVLIDAIMPLTYLSWEALAKGGASLAGMLAAITLSLRLMPKNMIAIGLGLFVVSLAITNISQALMMLSGLSMEEINRSLIALGGGLMILALGLNLMKGTMGGSASLVVAALALGILLPILQSLGAMSWESIIKGLVSIALAFGVLGLAGLLLKPLIPTILAMSMAFLGLGAAIALIGVGLFLAGVGFTALAAGVIALVGAVTAGATGLVAALSIIILGIAELIPTLLITLAEGIVAFAAVIVQGAPIIGSAIVTILVEVIKLLKGEIPLFVETMLEFILSVMKSLAENIPQIVSSLLDLVIGVINALTEKIPEILKAVAGFLAALFADIIDLVMNIDPAQIMQIVTGIGALAALFIGLAFLAVLAPAAMVGVIALGVLLAELALVIAAVGQLAQIPGLEYLIGEGGDFLQVIGTAIGQFVGGLVGGFASGLTSNLPQIALDLSSFMVNLTPFLTGAKLLDAESMNGVKALAETLLILTGAKLLDSITTFLTGGTSMADFGKELVPFGESIKAFSDAVAGVVPENIASAATAGKHLAEMAATIPNSGGILGKFFGENDMGAFGDGLEDFGSSLVAFSNIVTDLNIEAIAASIGPTADLIELASSLENSGGVLGWFMGENDLGTFGSTLETFGASIITFADTVSGMDAASIQPALDITSSLIELASLLDDNTGGAISLFTGDNDLGTFGETLADLADSLVVFSEKTAGLAFNYLLPGHIGALIGALSTEITFTEEGISLIGRSLINISNNLLTVSETATDISTANLTKIVTLLPHLSTAIASIDIISSENIYAFTAAINSLANANLSGFIEAFSQDTSGVIESVTALVTNFALGISENAFLITEAFDIPVQEVLLKYFEYRESFKTEGEEFAGSLSDGFQGEQTSINSAFKDVAGAAASALEGQRHLYVSAGEYLATGMEAGIKNKTQAIIDAAVAMAQQAIDAVRATTQEASPSKVTTRSGEFFGQGFINGIIPYIKTAGDIATQMAQGAVNGLNTIATKSSSIIDGINPQPVIRPVMDLSNVQKGAKTIQGLLSTQHAYGLSSGSYSNYDKIQNGSSSGGISFTQNITSPKAISTSEVYRQTKNQFSQVKEALAKV